MTLFTDDFARSAATTVGANYTYATSSSSTTMEIAGGAARSRATAVVALLLATGLGPDSGDQFAAVTLPSNTGASTGVGTRGTANGAAVTGYVATESGTLARITRLDGASGATVLGEVSRTRVANERLVLVSTATTHVLYANGAELVRVTDATYSTGRPFFRNSGTVDVTYDDFATGNYPADATGVSGVPQAPSSVPGQTTGLALSNETASTLDATWSATAGATSYVPEIRTNPSGAWTALASQAGTSCTFTGLAASTAYDVRVTPSNSLGPGTASSTATKSTTALPSTPPGQTTGLDSSATTSTSVSLLWTATPTATGYTVERRVNGTTEWQQAATGLTTTTYTATGLLPSTSYDFRVTPYSTAGTGTPSASITRTTAAATGSPIITTNPVNPDGITRWRGLIYNLAGERITTGDVLHRWHTEFYGSGGTLTLPEHLAVPEGTATATTIGRFTTAATVGARAGIRLAVPIVTTQLSAALVELRHMKFSVTDPSASWRLFIGEGNVGAQAIHLAGMDVVHLCSQGELNRTVTPQTVLGAEAHRRRHTGLLVSFATKEAWLLEGGSVIGYRDCATTWTDGTAQIGVSVTAETATAVELHAAALTITTYL